jgi:Signal transduction histidine kinase regulating C4-dicarboxylate transport system
MSLLEVIQLVGYGMGAALTLWMGALLLKWRRGLGGIERVLLALSVCIGLWHASNFLLSLHALLGLEIARWTNTFRLADSIAVVSITFAYTLLLHLHLYLWANARTRPLTLIERTRVFLSYIPTLFLLRALPHLWSGEYKPMLDKLAELQFLPWPAISFVQAFMLWAIYVLIFISVTDLIIAHLSREQSERRFMQTLAGSFVLIGLLIFAVYVVGLGRGTLLGKYLATLANLGSLLPTALLAHRIYRQRYLELVIRESLVVATFAAVVLVVYLYGIRELGVWLTERYGLRSGVVETLLILTLALVAQPLRKWLDNRFHKLFEREANLYREVVARIGTHAGHFRQLSELLQFVEARTAQDLGLRRVRLVALHLNEDARQADANEVWINELVTNFETGDGQALEDTRALKEKDYRLAYPLKRESRLLGVMLIDAPADALTSDTRAVLGVIAGQVAIAIEDYRLIEENVRLERRLAQDERLAALGQMAATVAHEVKNPLSAIKSIAQVLREDRNLHAYERDLGLIVGETDRLNSSITQLLSFARRTPESLSPARADELIQAVVALFRAQAEQSGISLHCNVAAHVELSPTAAAALRDALSNLLLNALQATKAGGRITIDAKESDDSLRVIVEDTGAGIPAELQPRIWEPFFTTRQRGTGLGLAIVRKRIEEAGGMTSLLSSSIGKGTSFELRLPI